MSEITVFNNFSNTKKPKHYTIDAVLDSIKKCTIQPQLDAIRAEKDDKIKKNLKKQLPCILFSGKFNERLDKSIIEHSGYVVLDWDNLDNLDIKKGEISAYPFVYSCFVSPSGNGLKAVVKIPAIIEKHRGYYKGLMKMFPDLDATSINESRICYGSCDKDIYINKDAVEFTDYVEVLDAKVNNSVDIKPILNNYSKAEIALKIIRESVDGRKHADLLKASKLMGGYIAGGLINENEAIRLLENEISTKGCDDINAANTTIKKGIEYGKSEPIQQQKKNKQEYVSKTQSVVSVEDEDFSFLSKGEDVDIYLNQWRTDTFVKGASTGLPSLDKYFVFKRGNFNVVNGFDNVGKSTALWYLCLLSSMYQKWNWILYSNENRNGTVVKKLIEFYWGVPINKITETQFNEGKAFVNKHFTIISNDFLFNYKDVLNIAEKLLKIKKYDGLLIDPYNSLKIELSNNSKLSTHEYHYEAASEMQVFTKKNDMCIYLNCHVITGAMRLQRGETKHQAPGKADTEGGGKFSNKADDFMTFHREVQDRDNYTKMQIHVRKIKEVETGGGYTAFDNPYILDMQVGMCGYADEYGYNPVKEWWKSKGKQITIEPNLNFENERQPITKSSSENLLKDEKEVYF